MSESKSPGQQMVDNLKYLLYKGYISLTPDIDRALKELHTYVGNLEKQYSKALHESGPHC